MDAKKFAGFVVVSLAFIVAGLVLIVIGRDLMQFLGIILMTVPLLLGVPADMTFSRSSDQH